MKKEAEGIVIQVNGNTAKVKLNRHGDCSNCGSCPGDNSMVMDVYNILYAKPGQRVAVELQDINMLKAAFIVYIMPLVAAALGAVAGTYAARFFGGSAGLFGSIAGFLAFVLAIAYIKYFDKSMGSEKKQPVIIRILS